ncbi:Microtubule -associated protein EB1 [Phytophthora megakarya]|uniref:Microtubule-associated protein EB1 n=1 Tax=Phytophthora megakarya TaxID=4795 RepID=A0A225VAH4_9STRA|nr:Microtubule -associated protein EB1 [Phytophthora megakarya]
MSAYLGRTELLRWVNAVCATELTKVEQMSSGAVACQVLDVLYPGQVPMHKVDWMATQMHECVHNYKLLQQALAVLAIDKHIAVDNLVRGKYQDNLELLQWLKSFYDSHETPKVYDARVRRAKGRGGAQYNKKLDGVSTSVKRVRSTTTDCRASRRETEEIAVVLEKMEKMKIQSEELTEEKNAMMALIQELYETIDSVKKERDFYLKKLTTIEELVHEAELSKTTSAQTNLLGLSVLDVVYATTEDEEEQELPF